MRILDNTIYLDFENEELLTTLNIMFGRKIFLPATIKSIYINQNVLNILYHSRGILINSNDLNSLRYIIGIRSIRFYPIDCDYLGIYVDICLSDEWKGDLMVFRKDVEKLSI